MDVSPGFSRRSRRSPASPRSSTSIAAAVAEVSRDAPRLTPRVGGACCSPSATTRAPTRSASTGDECKPHECDRGRARSAWQLHKNLYTAPIWDQLHGHRQHRRYRCAASDALKRAYFTCSRSGVPWLQATLERLRGAPLLGGLAGARTSAWPRSTACCARPRRASPPKRARRRRAQLVTSGLGLQSFEHARLAQPLDKAAAARSASGPRQARSSRLSSQRDVPPQRRQATIQ